MDSKNIEELLEDIKALSERQNSHYTDIMLQLKDIKDELAKVRDTAEGIPPDDQLYDEARELVIEMQKASTSLLQRTLRIGYIKASAILDMLEKEGVVGPADGASGREVLIREE